MGWENYLPHETGCQIKDKRFYIPTYLFLSFCAQGFINVQSGSNGQDASGTQTETQTETETETRRKTKTGFVYCGLNWICLFGCPGVTAIWSS